jgi:type I restriction enzyme M protein
VAIYLTVPSKVPYHSQALTQRVKELAERYETPLPQASKQVAELEQRVNMHLQKM